MNKFLILVFLFSCSLCAFDDSESSSDTEIINYEEEEPQDNDLSFFDFKSLENDLQNPQSVRFQINALLKPLSLEVDLNGPVLCIGTGRAEELLHRYHARLTLVREIDCCLDQCFAVKPDICDDAFALRLDSSAELVLRKFKIVFFAHAGTYFDFLFENASSLKLYSQILDNDGLFIFNSEVFTSEGIMLKNQCPILYSNKISLEDQVRAMLRDAGLEALVIRAWDESKNYTTNAASFLVVARKSISF